MNKKLGRYLRDARKRQSFTLRAAEKKTGISNAYLSQLENGKITKPSPSILYKLAELYRTSYDYLMELAGYPVPVKLVNEEKKLKPAFRSSNGFGDLTKEEEEELLEYLHFLRSRRRLKG